MRRPYGRRAPRTSCWSTTCCSVLRSGRRPGCRTSSRRTGRNWSSPCGGTPSCAPGPGRPDRKSTRLNSSHANISYAVFCLKKKKLNFSTVPLGTPHEYAELEPIPSSATSYAQKKTLEFKSRRYIDSRPQGGQFISVVPSRG